MYTLLPHTQLQQKLTATQQPLSLRFPNHLNTKSVGVPGVKLRAVFGTANPYVKRPGESIIDLRAGDALRGDVKYRLPRLAGDLALGRPVNKERSMTTVTGPPPSAESVALPATFFFFFFLVFDILVFDNVRFDNFRF
jgi:hypothetical protein